MGNILHRYTVDVEYNSNPAFHPITVTVTRHDEPIHPTLPPDPESTNNKRAQGRYEEILLLSNASDVRKVERVKELAARDGFHSFRIAAIDLDVPPDFTKVLRSK